MRVEVDTAEHIALQHLSLKDFVCGLNQANPSSIGICSLLVEAQPRRAASVPHSVLDLSVRVVEFSGRFRD